MVLLDTGVVPLAVYDKQGAPGPDTGFFWYGFWPDNQRYVKHSLRRFRDRRLEKPAFMKRLSPTPYAYLFGTCWRISKASPIVKDPAFWRGGNALKVARNSPTTSGSGYRAHA